MRGGLGSLHRSLIKVALGLRSTQSEFMVKNSTVGTGDKDAVNRPARPSPFQIRLIGVFGIKSDPHAAARDYPRRRNDNESSSLIPIA